MFLTACTDFFSYSGILGISGIPLGLAILITSVIVSKRPTAGARLSPVPWRVSCTIPRAPGLGFLKPKLGISSPGFAASNCSRAVMPSNLFPPSGASTVSGFI